MSIKKDEKNKTITSRNVIRIISQTEQIPLEEVQRVFNCFADLVELALSSGYTLSFPSSLGKVKTKKPRTIKKGTQRRLQDFMVENIMNDIVNNNDNTREVVEQSDGTYLLRYLKDVEMKPRIYFKFSRALQGRVGEALSNGGNN